MKRNIILATAFIAAVLTSFVMTGCSAASAGGGSTPPTAPAQPTGVVAAAAFDAVTLSWPAVTGATSYNLYWSTSTGVTPGNGTPIVGVTSPYNCTGTNGTTYYYVVTAVNAVGESAASSQVTAAPSASLPPAVPTGVTATPVSTTGVDILWTAVAGATSYNLYWSATAGLGTGGTKITGVTSIHHETLLTTGTPYYYVVTAVGTGGESAASAQVSAAPAPFVTGEIAINAADGSPLHESLNVYTDSTNNTGIASLTVKLNGTIMTDQGGGYYQVTTPLTISSGASISVDVAIGSNHYTVSATNFTSAPTVTAPASGAIWSHLTPNDSITWTAGSPLTGATYLAAVVDSGYSHWYYGSGGSGPVALPTSSLSASVPSSSWATLSLPGSLNVLMGIGTAGLTTQTGGIPVVGALPNSSIWIATATLVPITVN